MNKSFFYEFSAIKTEEQAIGSFLLDSPLYLNGIPRSLLRGFQVLAKSVPEGAKFRNTPSACGGDRNYEDSASLLF